MQRLPVLWKNGVQTYLRVHRTSSGQVIGVLNDCDLSSIQNVSSGHERTGTKLAYDDAK